MRRNYQMAYTPSGFWSRLITRLIVSVQRWRAIEQIKEESYSLVYWREGIGVVYEGGYFQVESYQELVGCVMVLCFSCCVTMIVGCGQIFPICHALHKLHTDSQLLTQGAPET